MKKKTVLFAVLDKFADWEGAYLSSALNMLAPAAFDIKTVAPSKSPLHSIGGFTLLPDCDINGAPQDADALILVGGLSWRTEEARRFIPLVNTAVTRNTVLGGICDAAAFLGVAGALNGVPHTANDLGDMKAWAGPAYTGEEYFLRRQAVSGGNIITANGTAPLEFTKEVLFALAAAPEAKIREWYEFHKLGFYSAPLPQM